MAVELQKLGYTNLHALDISQEMLNEAKNKDVYRRFICAALTDQQIPEIETGEFDALICSGSMFKGHVRSSALNEMVRMVKNGKSFLGTKSYYLLHACRGVFTALLYTLVHPLKNV